MNFNVIDQKFFQQNITDVMVLHLGLAMCDLCSRDTLYAQLQGADLAEIISLFEIKGDMAATLLKIKPCEPVAWLENFLVSNRQGFLLTARTGKPDDIRFNNCGEAVNKDFISRNNISIRAYDPSFEAAIEKLILAAEELQTSFEDELRAHRRIRIQHEKRVECEFQANQSKTRRAQ